MTKSKVFRLLLIVSLLGLLNKTFYAATLRPFIWKQKGAYKLRLSDNGHILAVENPGFVRVYDCRLHRIVGNVNFPRTEDPILDVSADGSRLVCIIGQNPVGRATIRVFGVGTNSISLLWSAVVGKKSVFLGAHFTGKSLLVLCNDGVISYSPAGKLGRKFPFDKVLSGSQLNSNPAGALSLDAKWAVVTDGYGKIAIFDVQSGRRVNSWTLKPSAYSNSAFYEFEFSSDRKTLTARSNHIQADGYDSVRGPQVLCERFYWALPEGKLIQDWDDTGTVNSSFSPNGKAGLREDATSIWFENLRSPMHKRSRFQLARPFDGNKAWIIELRLSKNAGMMTALNEAGDVWVQKRF